MSWLMNAKRRAKEGLLQAVGAHHATEDVEFAQKLKNFTEHVNHLQKVKDAMDLWVESLDTFGAATLMLSESFKGFFTYKPSVDIDMPPPPESPYLDISSHFVDISKKLNRVIIPSVRQLFELRCVQPAASILALVAPIDAMLQERRSVLLDFDSYRAKIEREHAAGRDSRHPMVIKKAMKLDEVAKQLHSLNCTIYASFVEFEKARLITLGPEFSAFVACFFHFTSHATELCSKIVPGLPQIASSLFVLESFIGQSFADIMSLTVEPVRIPPITLMTNRDRSETGADTPSDAGGSEEHPDGLVLSRSEYAGGAYGGYTSYTIVPPPVFNDTPADPATAPGADGDNSVHSVMEGAVAAGEALGRRQGGDGPDNSGKSLEDSVVTSTTSLPEDADTPAGQPTKPTSAPTSVPVPSAPVPAPASAPAPVVNRPTSTDSLSAMDPVHVPSAPSTREASPKLARVPSAASLHRPPLPVAQRVDHHADHEGDVPMATATIDPRPAKPQKPDTLRNASPITLSLLRVTSGGSTGQIGEHGVADRPQSSPVKLGGLVGTSPTSAATAGTDAHTPTNRNTIALAKQSSTSGNITEDLSLHGVLSPSAATPPPKPAKPPKPSRTPLPPEGVSVATTPVPLESSASTSAAAQSLLDDSPRDTVSVPAPGEEEEAHHVPEDRHVVSPALGTAPAEVISPTTGQAFDPAVDAGNGEIAAPTTENSASSADLASPAESSVTAPSVSPLSDDSRIATSPPVDP